ncbi:pseudouridylate synthase TRUB2, mitochondrial-like [Amphiura filiformis]|uniref:pseudouridylate synthase TRUB2, mitochondrial-like n=1 Tax=Amphiura filiformis TaxID=82378 RepID=UPI003B20C394
MNSLVKQGPESAYKVWGKVQGLLAVYKPADLSTKDVINTIETAVLQGLNQLKQRPQKTLVKIVQDETSVAQGNSNVLMAVKVASLADHPLVAGPRYTRIKTASSAKGIDRKSTGVMVLAVGSGTRKLEVYKKAKLSRTLSVKGRLGFATDSHDPEGKIWEKTTYNHVTRDKLDCIIGSIHRETQKTIIRGLLHPVGETPPLILNAKCVDFNPPDFELELECLSASSQYLRFMIHDIGLELKSSAVATQIRCIRDGPFTLEHALLRKHWKLPYIIEGIAKCRNLVKHSQLVPPEVQRQVLEIQEGIDESVRLMEGSNVKDLE